MLEKVWSLDKQSTNVIVLGMHRRDVHDKRTFPCKKGKHGGCGAPHLSVIAHDKMGDPKTIPLQVGCGESKDGKLEEKCNNNNQRFQEPSKFSTR